MDDLKKIWVSEVLFSWNYGLEKAELLKYPKKTRVTTVMESQHVKRSDTLLKSSRQYFCYIFCSLSKKFQKTFFDFKIIAFELVELNTRFYWERILVIGCRYVNKQSQNFRYYSNKIFVADFVSEWSKNLAKILQWRFMQCFGRFNILIVHKCSDKRLFRHLSNIAFWSL